MALVVIIAAIFIPYRSFVKYSGIENIVSGAPRLVSQAVYPWANFDGVHYLQIAGQGYSDQARFLPLYPGLLNAVARVFSTPTLSIAQVTLALLMQVGLTCVLIFSIQKLWSLDLTPVQTKDATLYLIFAPTAFFLSAVYTESIFLVLCVLALLLVRQKRTGLAILLATLVGMTRLNGLVIMVPLAMEIWQASRPGWKAKILALAPLSIVPTGLVMYVYYNFLRWGDWLAFLHGHAQLANGRAADTVVIPLQTMYRYVQILTSLSMTQYEWWLAALEVVMTIGTGWLLYQGYKFKTRPSLWWFSALIWLIPVLSGTWSGMPRYSLLVLSIYPILAQLFPVGKYKWVIWVSAILQIGLLVCFSRGYLVG